MPHTKRTCSFEEGVKPKLPGKVINLGQVELSISKREYSTQQIFSHRLRTGSLEEIVVKIVLDRDDSEFVSSFLTSYCVLCSPNKLLSMFIELYKSPRIKFSALKPAQPSLGESSSEQELYLAKAEVLEHIVKHQNQATKANSPPADISLSNTVRVNIALIIKRWTEMFFDFYDNNALFERLNDFVRSQELKKKRNLQAMEILQQALNVFRDSSTLFKNRMEYPVVKALAPKPIFPILGGKISPEHIAQQLTLLEYDLTRNVRPRDLLQQIPSESGPLHTYANHFKNVRQFFVAEILSQANYKAMATAIKRAISVAQICVSYNNFNTVMEILSALCTPSVICNEKAWDLIDNKVLKIFEDLSNQLCSDDNYASYRKVINSIPNPCVPFLGVHVGDIRFIDDFNQTVIIDTLNVDKIRLLAKEITKLQGLQGSEYKFAIDSEFRTRFIEDFCHISELQPSLTCEHIANNAPERLKTLRDRYENYYTDSTILGQEEFNLCLLQLRARDWSIISSSARKQTFQPDELIYEQETKQNNSEIAFLKTGEISIKRNEIILRTVAAPMIIGALGILDSVDSSFQVFSDDVCEVEFVETRLLVSLLESDSHLSLRFFTELSFQLIRHIHDTASLRADGERTLRLRRSQRMNSFAEGTVINQHLVVKPASVQSNPSLHIDPKVLRDRHFRKLFDFPEEEVLIKEYKASLFSRTISAPGTLFVSQKHVCFYVKLFNHKSKISLNYTEITKITKKKSKITLETVSKKRKIVVRLKEPEDDDAFSLLENIMNSLDPKIRLPVVHLGSSNLENHTSSLEKWRETSTENSLGLTEEDWKLILGGAKRHVSKRGAVLISQGTNFQRIFQVIRGNCRIERTVTKQNGERSAYVVASIAPTEIFGEISFVQRRGATANVIVDSDELEVFIIEGYYIKRLLQLRPELASRFLHYICCVLQRRLNQNDRFENQEERKVVNLIAEPLHHNLVKHPVLPADSLDPIVVLDGPLLEEDKEAEKKTETATPFCCGTAISTYPMLPVRTNDPNESPRFAREGSPICDQYKCFIYPNRLILGVADGCNWGDPPRNAARAAIDAFTRYLCAHQAEIGDLQYAGGLVLRALSMANAEIFKGIDREKSMVGTTTLLGGIVLELDSLSMEIEESDGPAADFGFVYVSIGDCKAFHWSSVTKKFSDITASNRAGTLSASDCGGRLGPHCDGNLPDLRNLELGFFACHTGDYIMIVSDGVHDNLDPAHLGFQPRDLGIDAEEWASVPDLEAAEEVKNEYRISLLAKVINGELDSAVRKRNPDALEEIKKQKINSSENVQDAEGIPSPLEVVNNITSYCAETCNAAASWMVTNPKGRLPKDYRLYPGKMDHTTCLCVRIGDHNHE